jgi:amino acid permease
MSTNDRVRNSRGFRNPMLILGVVMTAFYVILGSLLLFVKSFLPEVGTDFRNIFAAMLIIYGIYRGWRVYADHYKNQ